MAVIPAPKNPSCVAGSVSCGCDADVPPPTPLAAVRLATMGPRAAAAAAARSLIAPSCLRRGATPSLAAFPRERAFAAQRAGALCGARSPVEVSMFVHGRTRRQAPVLRSSLVRRRRAAAESLDDALKKPTRLFFLQPTAPNCTLRRSAHPRAPQRASDVASADWVRSSHSADGNRAATDARYSPATSSATRAWAVGEPVICLL